MCRFPIKVAKDGSFQSRAGVFNHFYNGINGGETKQASDAYVWVIGVLFGAWVFYGEPGHLHVGSLLSSSGYDASAHLAEETHDASIVVCTTA
jgi:hypothetical protein